MWIVLLSAVAGLVTFGLMVRSATSTAVIPPDEAMRRFDERLAASGPPLLVLAPDGSVVKRSEATPGPPAPIERVNVWVYRTATQRFVETRVPFWFFRLKAPAARYALEGTGLDLESLGITAAELTRRGPGVVLDRRTPLSRVLIWTD